MGNKTKRVIAPYLASMMVGLLLVGFQNCTVATEFSSAQQVAAKGGGTDDGVGSDGGAGGNGTGYEGKTYAYATEQAPCDDGNLVRARIRVKKDGLPYLVRIDCKRIPREKQIPLDTQLAVFKEFLAAETGLYVYQEHIFLEEPEGTADDEMRLPAPPNQNPQPKVVAFCGYGDSIKRVFSDALIFQKPDAADSSQPTTQFHQYTVNVMTTYLNSGIVSNSSSGNCRQGSKYFATLDIQGMVNPSQIYLQINPYNGGGDKFQLYMAGTPPTNLPIPITADTSYPQYLFLGSGTIDDTVSCENQSSSGSGNGAMLGKCYLVQ